MTVTNASINRFYQRMADRLTGKADVTAQAVGTTDNVSMPEAVVGTLRRTPGVSAATGALYGTASATVTLSGNLRAAGVRPLRPGAALPRAPVTFNRSFGLAGTDFTSAPRLQDLQLQTGRLPRAGADELVVPAALAAGMRAGPGARLDVSINGRSWPFTVVGILRDGGLGAFGGAQPALLPLDVAQQAMGRPGRIVAVAVALQRGVRHDRWVEAHRDVFGPGVTVTDTVAAFEPLRRTFQMPSRGFLAVSTLALWLAVFLIYLSVSMNVLERTRLFGGLFALGATRRQVGRLVLVEAGLLGVVGSAAGLVVGVGFSGLLVGLTARWFGLQRPPLVVTPVGAAVGFVAGCSVTLVASALPARRAARLSAVEALRTDAEPATAPARTWLIGVPLLVGAVLLLPAVASNQVLPMLVGLALLLGAVLVVPAVLAPVARFVGRLTERIERGTGRVAVMHLVNERSRSALSLGLVMVVLAMVIGLRGATTASHELNDRQLASQFGADLRVFHESFDEAALELVRGTPGVARATAVSYANPPSPLVDAPSEPLRIEMVEPAAYFDVAGFAWGDGDTASARAALARGGSVLLPMQTAMHLHLHRGDRVRLATTAGPRPFRIAATYVALVSGPNVVVGEADGRSRLGMGRPTEVDVRAAKGVTVAALENAIVRRAGRSSGGFGFSTSQEMAVNVRGNLDRASRLYDSLLLVCLLVSMLGLGNTLAMSMFERRREVGVLRAIGTGRLSIGRMVVTEAATLVLVALVLAVPLGAALADLTIRVLAGAFGFRPRYVFPWRVMPGLAALAGIVVVVASLLPARRASGLDVIEALRLD